MAFYKYISSSGIGNSYVTYCDRRRGCVRDASARPSFLTTSSSSYGDRAEGVEHGTRSLYRWRWLTAKRILPSFSFLARVKVNR